MSTLLAGGLPLVPSLETAGASIQSRTVARAALGAAERVREGLSLSRSLDETKMFPELALEMIEVGESTGAMREMLNSVAEFYEEDVESAWRQPWHDRADAPHICRYRHRISC